MFTLLHPLINYLVALPIRKRIDIIALLLASILPDVEGAYYTMEAYKTCAAADMTCLAEYPSHYMLHSFFGIFLIIAPVTLLLSAYLRKRAGLKTKNLKVIYGSALAGGLLHLLVDATYHKGADALYLLWPAQTQYSFAFEGSYLLWGALAAMGLVAFLWLEKKRIGTMIK